jgi:hypothetical protein
MIKYEKLGIFLSKPIAFFCVLVYLFQSAFIVVLVRDRFELQKQIDFQQKRILELEEKLKVLKVIDDFQIGFTDEEKGQLADVISSECRKYDYDPMFLISLILTESSMYKHQVSTENAQGLMQIRPITGKDLADKMGIDWKDDTTLYQPELNIRMGSLHLFRLILEFKDVKKALVSYNLGENAFKNRMRLNMPMPRSFLDKIMSNYKMLKERYTL